MAETREVARAPVPVTMARLDTSRGTPPETQAIATDRRGPWEARAVVVDRQGAAAASYQRFAWHVQRGLEARGATSVAITSAVRHEGKTVTACNLALASAALGRGRVALVDLDLRGPSVGSALGLHPRLGFERCLGEGASLREARVATDVRALDVYPARVPHPDDAHERLAGSELGAVFAELRHAYDIVVVDTPPVLAAPDAAVIMKEVECAVVVVRAGYSKPAALAHALEFLPRDRLLGLFLNSVRSTPRSDRYHYYESRG